MPTAAKPPLSRAQVERVLGLEEGASDEQLEHRSGLLLSRLGARANRAEQARDNETTARIERERSRLEASVVYWTSPGAAHRQVDPPTRVPTASSARAANAEPSLGGVVSLREGLRGLALLLLGLLLGWSFAVGDDSGENGTGLPTADAGGAEATTEVATGPATLLVGSRPESAQVRVRNAAGEEIVARPTAPETPISLAPGRYDIEVWRADCPDDWSRSLELEPGESRRYEPRICRGAGELVVRSNVSGDRVQIDQFDVGATRSEPHVLGVGDHTVRVTKRGYRPFEGRVRIRPDERIELRAELIRTPSKTAGQAKSSGAAKESAPGPKKAVAAKPTPPAPPSPGGSQAAGVPPPRGEERPFEKGRDLRETLREELRKGIGEVGPQAERVPVPRPALDFDPKASTGGSTTWHDRVSARILARFDQNGSGTIDRAEENAAIPCAFWTETEGSFDEGGLGISMTRLYGFDGSEWHPGALGFDRDLRDVAYQRMTDCGLAP